MKNTSTYPESSKTSAMKRPRFSLLQGIVAIVATVAVTACIVGGHQTRQTPAPKAPSQAVNVAMADGPSNAGAVAWIIEPLRAACAEWNDESGRYAWITSGLKTQGITQDDILAFCDTFQSACS